LNSVGGKYNNTSHIDYNRKKKEEEEEACRVILLDVTAYIRLPDTPFSPAPPPLSLCSALHHLSYRETHSQKKKKMSPERAESYTMPSAHHHHSISINDITFYRWRETISFFKCRRLNEILQKKRIKKRNQFERSVEKR
jgi:hypothetical protein